MSYAISPGQVRYIQTMRRKLWGDDDAAYREMLGGVARVQSCKELKGPQIDLVIKHLEKCLGIDKPKPSKKLSLIYRLWREVSRAPVMERKKALRTFVKNRFGLGPPEWLNNEEMNLVIEALKAMAGRQGQESGARNRKGRGRPCHNF